LIEKHILDLVELEKFSNSFIGNLKKTDVVLFKGELGSGKTTFIRFLIKKLYLFYNLIPPEIIPSPTFNIMQSYKLKDFVIHHYDFYRIKNSKEFREINFDENIKGNISFIEWPEIILPFIKKYSSVTVELSIVDKNKREFNIYYK